MNIKSVYVMKLVTVRGLIIMGYYCITGHVWLVHKTIIGCWSTPLLCNWQRYPVGPDGVYPFQHTLLWCC